MKENKNVLPTFIHWFSWTISLIASIVFAYFLIVEQFAQIINGSDKHLIAFVPFLIIAIAGCIWSIFQMRRGAIAMIAGGTGMVVIIALQDGMSEFGLMVIYSVIYILPGLFFLLTSKAHTE